jgi:hypothetical protein
MGRSTTSILVNEFAARPDMLRRAVVQHKSWIDQQLGVSLSEAVILEPDFDPAVPCGALTHSVCDELEGMLQLQP